jgi:nitrogen fixation/metabolism regulation signal transduction histidine kinase
LPAPEQAILTKSVKTIVDQVDAMKRLVNEFRDYARLPAAELKPLDLNALLTDILQLYESEDAHVRCAWNSTRAARASWVTPSSCARWCTTCCRTPGRHAARHPPP